MSGGTPLSPRAHQHGQALTEFLVVATFLLIPLLLLIPVIASLICLKQDVEMAARYAAWERTVWTRTARSGLGGPESVKSDERIAREIDARIFSADNDEPLTSSPAAPTRLDPFSYRPHNGERLLKARADSSGAEARYATQRSAESDPGGLAGVSGNAIAAFGHLTRFDLDRRGQVDATVSVDIADLVPVFGLVNVDLDALRLTRRNRLFVEAWTGGARRDTENLVSGLLPQQFMDNAVVHRVQDFAAFAPGASEIDSDSLEFGHADIEPLPAYRLGPRSPR